jgi:hypothetical protein
MSRGQFSPAGGGYRAARDASVAPSPRTMIQCTAVIVQAVRVLAGRMGIFVASTHLRGHSGRDTVASRSHHGPGLGVSVRSISIVVCPFGRQGLCQEHLGPEQRANQPFHPTSPCAIRLHAFSVTATGAILAAFRHRNEQTRSNLRSIPAESARRSQHARTQGDETTRPAYRELAAARIGFPVSGFIGGPEWSSPSSIRLSSSE